MWGGGGGGGGGGEDVCGTLPQYMWGCMSTQHTFVNMRASKSI